MDHTDKSQGDSAEFFRFLSNQLVLRLKQDDLCLEPSMSNVLTQFSAG